MKKYVFTLLLAGMMVVMTACGNNMNDATGGNQNDTVNDSTTNDNGTTNDDTMNNDRNNFMITAGDLEIEREAMEVSLDMDKDEKAVTINTPYLSIFCC